MLTPTVTYLGIAHPLRETALADEQQAQPASPEPTSQTSAQAARETKRSASCCASDRTPLTVTQESKRDRATAMIAHHITYDAQSLRRTLREIEGLPERGCRAFEPAMTAV
jgi:hypothetical protein